ncbi:LapA family protein [uncultured Planktosalinus sp.]|uniref:LapA family protein n=1 Tax=uncultured Planktosalinus sp. TaxID=1810935 RepID=UPI0030D865F8
MKILKKTILFLFLIVVIIFAIQNSQTTNIEFFNWGMTLPVSLIVILIYILGMTTGGLLSSVLRKLMNNEDSKDVHNDWQK